MSHPSAHAELDRILATGCPDERIAALLRNIADRFEEARVLAETKRGNRGNACLGYKWPIAAGRPLMPEDVAPRPLCVEAEEAS